MDYNGTQTLSLTGTTIFAATLSGQIRLFMLISIVVVAVAMLIRTYWRQGKKLNEK